MSHPVPAVDSITTKLPSRKQGHNLLEFGLYFLASGIALLVDTCVFSLSLRLFGIPVFWAGALGFVTGSVVIYILSVHYVFKQRTLVTKKNHEFALFLGIGLMGLVITQIILWLGISRFGLMPEAVKLCAACATFISNFLLRKILLFSSNVFKNKTKE